MSIRVALDDLPAVVGTFEWAYLVTLGAERPQIEAQRLWWEDGAIRLAGAGRTSSANLARTPTATLVFPPIAAAPDSGSAAAEPGPDDSEVAGSVSGASAPDGYTLIVDGTAEVVASVDDAIVVVRPTSAVFHRPAPQRTGG